MVFYLGNSTITTKLSVNTTHDSGDITGIIAASGKGQVRVMCKGNDAVIKFGTSTVQASNSYTDDDLPAGNTVILAGAVEVFDLPPDVTHCSVICEDGAATTGNVWITPSRGEE